MHAGTGTWQAEQAGRPLDTYLIEAVQLERARAIAPRWASMRASCHHKWRGLQRVQGEMP